MNKKFLTVITFIIIAVTTTIPVKAENLPNILTSSGTASINAEPDTAVLSFAIETENKLLTQALQDNSDKARKVTTEIKKLLGKDDSIKTTGFNANPIYNYDNKERKSVLTGYRITNSISIKTKKISDIGKIIDTAIKCGANRADDLDFIVENREKYSGELLKKASERAKQKASTTAGALGVYIKGINRVTANFSDEAVSPYYRGVFSSMEMKSDTVGAAPPVEAGQIKLNATVTVDFLIENIINK